MATVACGAAGIAAWYHTQVENESLAIASAADNAFFAARAKDANPPGDDQKRTGASIDHGEPLSPNDVTAVPTIAERVQGYWDAQFPHSFDLSRQLQCLSLALISQRWLVQLMLVVAEQASV